MISVFVSRDTVLEFVSRFVHICTTDCTLFCHEKWILLFFSSFCFKTIFRARLSPLLFPVPVVYKVRTNLSRLFSFNCRGFL